MADRARVPLDRTNQVIATLSGFVLLVAALGLAILITWIVARQLVIAADMNRTVLLLSAAIAAVAGVCGTIGFRLAFNRPNRYHSLLPPFGWYAMAAVFVAFGSVLGFELIRDGNYEQLVAAGCAILLGYWSWKAGRIAAARGRGDSERL